MVKRFVILAACMMMLGLAIPSSMSYAQSPQQPTEHIVQPGENLFRIGLRYGYTVSQLAIFNNIGNPDRIQAGQVIALPVDGVTLTTVTTTTTTTTTVTTTTTATANADAVDTPAQETAPVNAATPTVNNGQSNACDPGGAMFDKCDTVWEWKAGWHLQRYIEAGGNYTVPAEFTSIVPPTMVAMPRDPSCYFTQQTNLTATTFLSWDIYQDTDGSNATVLDRSFIGIGGFNTQAFAEATATNTLGPLC